ncbi:MAG TPA: TatD family hydrolase [Saprospiraceae bacterium]|nr:TatD family hydrolase [Saprospiraceae bacterium]
MESLQLHWVDTHCHLYADEFEPDQDEMISRALNHGVRSMLLPNIDLTSVDAMHRLVARHPEHCFPMMGLHPCSVKADYDAMLGQLKLLLDTGTYSGIGETGIDLYWDTTFKEEQIIAFETQMEWAKAFDLPIIIHSRESLDLNIQLIADHQDGRLRGIFHCFGGTFEQAMRIHELDFMIGIGGVVTYKKSELGEVIRKLPRSMIVLETDAPYLSPAPHRGKRNEPAYIPVIAAKVAESLLISIEELAEITTNNASGVFKKNL